MNELKNAKTVLSKVEAMIERGCAREIRQVCNELSIFDWWPEMLTISHMKQMRTFLKAAIKLGYTSNVSFKVGASGCANGMWAYKEKNGVDGDCLYRSFTPDYTYYSFNKNGKWLPEGNDYDSLKTIKMLERALENA